MRFHQKQSRHQTGTVIPTATATAILLSIVVWREEKDESSRLVDHSLYFHCPERQWWMNDKGWFVLMLDQRFWCLPTLICQFFSFFGFVFVLWFFLVLVVCGFNRPFAKWQWRVRWYGSSSWLIHSWIVVVADLLTWSQPRWTITSSESW